MLNIYLGLHLSKKNRYNICAEYDMKEVKCDG